MAAIQLTRSHSAPELVEDGYAHGALPTLFTPPTFFTPPVVESVLPRPNSAPELLESGDEHGTHPTLDSTPVVVEAVEEDYVRCRICTEELQEGAHDTLMLGCHCRAELAIAHRECAVKWFNIRGDRICEICHQEVMNLPVLRYPTLRFIRVWQHEPILLIVSMIAYLVLLQMFLLKEWAVFAIAISLPFGFLLGLLGSTASTIMVRRSYAWIYSALEFILVVFVAYAFRYSQLHLSAVIYALLATVAGFGGPMCFTYIFWKWRGLNQH